MNNFINMSDFIKTTKGQTQSNQDKINNNSAQPLQKTVSLDAPQNIATDLNKSPLNKPAQKDTVELNNALNIAKRQNGLIEKIADKIKSLTGLGLSSKKIQEKINRDTDEAAITKEIKNYRIQQENTAQAAADTLSSAGSIAVFFGIKQNIQKLVAKYWTLNNGFSNEIKEYLDSMKINKVKNLLQNAQNFANKHLDKKSTAIVLATIGAMWAGSFIKKNLLKINRIGTSQYKALKTEDMDKKEIKQAKKEAKKAKKNANRRNAISGAINGLMTPILTVGGGLMAPVYIIGNLLNRYFIANREERGEKSLKSFIENIKQTPIINALSAALIAIPAIKSGRADKIFDKNLQKVTEKIKNAKLTQTTSSVSTYRQLEDILFDDPRVKEILNDSSLTTSQQIDKLSEYNIFAVKFKQINISAQDNLAKALKTECPPTRVKMADGKMQVDIEGVQKEIENVFGKKYKVEKCVGVGTIAETYLAKDENGAEVCIKMLKKGIDEAKIDRDKEAFIGIIRNLKGKTQEEKEFLIKNIENIAAGVRQEVNLQNEMTAAQELAKVTHRVNVVKPVEVKNNIYVMEKAKGVNLSDFTTFMRNHSWWKDRAIDSLPKSLEESQNELKDLKGNLEIHDKYIGWYNDLIKKYPELSQEYIFILPDEITKSEELEKIFRAVHDVETCTHCIGWDGKRDEFIYAKGKEAMEKRINETAEEIKELARYIELRNDKNFTSITADETQRMLEAYQDALVEQFYKIDGTDKIIHGDIHPGNIFIDLEALKRGDSKFLTLIDTGNTIKQSPQTALRMLNLTKYIENADTENIVDLILEGAKLPEGLTKDKARQAVLEELNKIFFDDKTQLDTVTTQSLMGIMDSIMQKLNIIPSDTQGNLLKSKQSAHQSLREFMDTFANTKVNELMDKAGDGKKSTLAGFAALKNIYSTVMKYAKKQKKQEKLNLKAAQARGKVNLQKSPSTPKKNSENYLTYYLKQGKMPNLESTKEQMSEAMDKKINTVLGLG